ncbi:hypothetical protein F4859DRAFT_512684 [Xylaria cf. heliscus]|nr:hypothetical protein F4859DRAFT_512684 [Xylaria cf. heliscus]
MAPQSPPPSTLVFDSRTQIIDNCEFLICKDDIVQVITSKDPAEKFFKAYAIKCNEDTRELVLVSDPCENAQKAIESLHTKSCEAIHNYITTNGFSNPRDLKATLLEPNLDDDDAASVISAHSDSSTAAISEWGSSGDEAMMLHHTSGTNGAPKDRQPPAGRPGNRTTAAAAGGGAHEPVAGSRSRAAVRSSPDYASPANPAPPRTRAARPARPRSPSFAFRQPPPPPPPGYPAHPKSDGPPAPPPSMRGTAMPPHPQSYPVRMGPGPHHPSRLPNGMNPPMPSAHPFVCYHPLRIPIDRAPFPAGQGVNRPPVPSSLSANASSNGSIKRTENNINQPRPLSVLHPPTRIYTVGLMVHWVGHGQHRIIAQVHPTLQALQDAAIGDVRLNPSSFTGESMGMKGPAGPSNRDEDGSDLVAHVRKGVVAGETYDMRGFQGNDLSGLFQMMAAGGMPTFEVIVRNFRFHIVVRDTPRDGDDNDGDDDDDDDDEASVQGIPSPMKGEMWD